MLKRKTLAPKHEEEQSKFGIHESELCQLCKNIDCILNPGISYML